jgi:hypothetical protein
MCLFLMPVINSCFGKSGAGMLILQVAKTGFLEIFLRRFHWRGVGLDG